MAMAAAAVHVADAEVAAAAAPVPAAAGVAAAAAAAQVPPWARLAHGILLRCCPQQHPATALLAFTLASRTNAANGIMGLPNVPQHGALPPGLLTRIGTAFQALGPPATPGPLRDLLTSPPGLDPSPALSALVWTRPAPAVPGATGARAPQPVPVLQPLPAVRTLTALLGSAVVVHRLARHAAFCRLALGRAGHANVSQEVGQFKASLGHAWHLPCANSIKEPLWRLALDAIPAGNYKPWRCPCNQNTTHPCSRSHAFWDCPVAHAVRKQLNAALGLPAGAPGVSKASVWLLGPPPAPPNIHPSVWRLVSLAAVAAMEHGRTLLWARRHGPSWPDPGPAGLSLLLARTNLPANVIQSHIHPLILAARGEVVRSVCHMAAARFWVLLQDFAAAHPVVAGWDLPPTHPFLSTNPDGNLSVRVPPSGGALQ